MQTVTATLASEVLAPQRRQTTVVAMHRDSEARQILAIDGAASPHRRADALLGCEFDRFGVEEHGYASAGPP